MQLINDIKLKIQLKIINLNIFYIFIFNSLFLGI